MSDPISLGILAGVAAWVLAVAMILSLRNRRNEEDENGNPGLPVEHRPCDRCGKPVLVGAELYHAKHCLGRPRGVRVENRYSERRRR